MFVFIDNSNREEVSFSYCLDDGWKEKSFEVKDYKPLLYYFDKLLKNTKQKKEDLKGIAVLIGVGGFTSTRVATITANTLGFSLGIPVLAVNKVDVKNLEQRIKKVKIGQYISATYSGEPNIGVKKVKS